MNTVLEVAGSTRESGTGFWTPEYLLHHCEGYLVDGPGGHVGFVSEVVETGDSVELVVVGGAGAEIRVQAEAICSLDAGSERIAVTRTGS